jgi:hypothetical protein
VNARAAIAVVLCGIACVSCSHKESMQTYSGNAYTALDRLQTIDRDVTKSFQSDDQAQWSKSCATALPLIERPRKLLVGGPDRKLSALFTTAFSHIHAAYAACAAGDFVGYQDEVAAGTPSLAAASKRLQADLSRG